MHNDLLVPVGRMLGDSVPPLRSTMTCCNDARLPGQLVPGGISSYSPEPCLSCSFEPCCRRHHAQSGSVRKCRAVGERAVRPFGNWIGGPTAASPNCHRRPTPGQHTQAARRSWSAV